MGLDPEVIRCQNKETYDECTTRQFLDHIRDMCGCLPLALRLSDEVGAVKFRLNFDLQNHFQDSTCATDEEIQCSQMRDFIDASANFTDCFRINNI